MYIYTYIYIYIYIYISADLFQSSSVLAYSCNPQCLPIQHPQSLPILTHLEASEHPSIQVSLTAGIPYSIILKGPQLRPAGVHRGPQAFSGRQTSSPHMLPFAPLGPQIDAPACTGVPNSSLEHPV